jgi:hypothetical protein
MAWSGSRGVNTTAAGYGNSHQKLRAALAKRHQPTDPCVRCGHALGPMGPWLHLDHNDARTGYLGFSHGRRCNVCGRGATSGLQHAKREPYRYTANDPAPTRTAGRAASHDGLPPLRCETLALDRVSRSPIFMGDLELTCTARFSGPTRIRLPLPRFFWWVPS